MPEGPPPLSEAAPQRPEARLAASQEPESQEPAAPAPSDPVEPPTWRGLRLVGLCTLASRVLGMARDVAMAAAFGAGPVMDAFALAFRIPNLARRLFGEGAQTSAFLPVFVRTQEHAGQDAARELAAGVFRSLGGMLIVLTLLVEALLAGVWLLCPLSVDSRLLVELLLLLFPYLIGICLAAQQSAVLHGLRQFLWPAVLPIVLNLIWLAAIPAAFALTDDPVTRIRWLCGAILFAGGWQLLIPVVVLSRQGYSVWRRGKNAAGPTAEVFRALGPVLIGVAVTQINTVLDSLIAWGLAPGSAGRALAAGWLPELPNGTASALYFGQRMYQFPLGLIGVGLGTVLFPQLTRHAGRADWDGFRRDLLAGLKLTLAIGVPAGWGLALLAEPITRLFFQHGAFTPEAGALTTRMIFAYGIGVPAFIGLLTVQRGYYAVGDRWTPLRHALLAMVCNIALDIGLLAPCGAAGLAWATTLSAVLQCALATLGLERHAGRLDWRSVGWTACQTALACAAMTLAVDWTSLPASDRLLDRAAAVALPLIAGVAAYFAAAALVGLKEPWRVVRHGEV